MKMTLERHAWGLFMKIFIGMYIAFLISIISFTPHPSELEPRFGLPVGGLFAAVGNKYIIDSLLPESSFFTLVDTLHTITFMSIFATLVVSAITLKLHDSNKDQQAIKVNSICSRIVISLYIILNLIFIGVALF
jgi:L-asparagine transporter-like permease